MAWKDVELSEEERASMAQKFYKFEAIGQKLYGRVVRIVPQTGQYAKPGMHDFVIRTKNTETGEIEEVVLNPPTDLAALLKKAGVAPNHAIEATYASDRDVGKASPMKCFKLRVNTEAPAQAAAPKPAPAPVPKPADDLEF